jgi:hypothetical protein
MLYVVCCLFSSEPVLDMVVKEPIGMFPSREATRASLLVIQEAKMVALKVSHQRYRTTAV